MWVPFTEHEPSAKMSTALELVSETGDSQVACNFVSAFAGCPIGRALRGHAPPQAKMLDVLDGFVDGVSSGEGTESLAEGLLGDPDFHSCMGVRPLTLPNQTDSSEADRRLNGQVRDKLSRYATSCQGT